MGAKRCCFLCGGVLNEALYCRPCRYRVESWLVVLRGRAVAVGRRDGSGIVVEEAFLEGLQDLAGCGLTVGTPRSDQRPRGRGGAAGQEA